MALQDRRVSNPPPPEPSTSTSERPVDASYSLGPRQQPVRHAFSPGNNNNNNYNISYLYEAGRRPKASTAPVVAHSPLSKSGVFGSSPEDIQPRAGQTGGTWTNPQVPINGPSVWNPGYLLFDNSASSAHQMAVLRNRVVGFPALAPTPTPRKPAPVTKPLVETSQLSSAAQLESKSAAAALLSLAPKSNKAPNGNKVVPAVQAQQPIPLPASGPLLTPTTAPNQQTPMTSPLRKTPVTSRKRRNRRKRAHDSDDEIKANDSSSDDVSDDMLPVARQTKSGRQVNRPTFFAPSPEPKQSPRQRPSPSGTATTPGSGAPAKRRRKVYRKNGKDINITCMRCQRGHTPATNSIVFCDECNSAWHQFCHDPPISKQLIDVKEAEWFCSECRPGQRVKILKLRLPQKPKPVSTESSLVPLVCGSQFTAEEQRGYLSSLSHAALVDMLISLSNTNPTVPVFPENLKDLRQSKFFTTSTPNQNSQSTSSEKSKAAETGDQTIEPVTEQPKDAESSDAMQDTDDSGSEYEVEEHRLYPRPGNGFCLPPEEDDLDILLDDPACSTFSYTLHRHPQMNALADNALTIKIAG